MSNFIETCNHDIPIPYFAKLVDHQLVLAQEKITLGQAEGLAAILRDAASKPILVNKDEHEVKNERLVKVLSLNECEISDQSLASILEAISLQSNLKVISITNTKIGDKAIKAFSKVLS